MVETEERVVSTLFSITLARLKINIFLICLVAATAFGQWNPLKSNTTASLRGLSIVNGNVVWASGTDGTFVRTTDAGDTWQAGTVPGAEKLDFHGVYAVDAKTAYLMSIGNGNILCVDDYETSLAGWCLYLQKEGFSVTTARTAQEGLQLFAVSPVDLVLLDYTMPDSNGDEVAATMKHMKPDVCILMFSGVPHVPENARLHVDAFLQKGQSPTLVEDKIRELLKCSRKAA
jgi:CheY-like chemotaxis protein